MVYFRSFVNKIYNLFYGVDVALELIKMKGGYERTKRRNKEMGDISL